VARSLRLDAPVAFLVEGNVKGIAHKLDSNGLLYGVATVQAARVMAANYTPVALPPSPHERAEAEEDVINEVGSFIETWENFGAKDLAAVNDAYAALKAAYERAVEAGFERIGSDFDASNDGEESEPAPVSPLAAPLAEALAEPCPYPGCTGEAEHDGDHVTEGDGETDGPEADDLPFD
jgi:hypothetical protein